jgi:hypothetical protein
MSARLHLAVRRASERASCSPTASPIPVADRRRRGQDPAGAVVNDLLERKLAEIEEKEGRRRAGASASG